MAKLLKRGGKKKCLSPTFFFFLFSEIPQANEKNQQIVIWRNRVYRLISYKLFRMFSNLHTQVIRFILIRSPLDLSSRLPFYFSLKKKQTTGTDGWRSENSTTNYHRKQPTLIACHQSKRRLSILDGGPGFIFSSSVIFRSIHTTPPILFFSFFSLVL